MHGYLYRFLTSPDATFQHIAVWTIVQLLESEGQFLMFRVFILNSVVLTPYPSDPQLMSNIRNSDKLLPHIRDLAASRSASPSSSMDSRSRRSHSQSYQETETGDGSSEIQVLARKILEATEAEAMPLLTHTPSTQSVARNDGLEKSDDELRRSVRAAFSSQ